MNRINKLYAKIEGNDHVVTFSLLMNKEIEINNLLASERVPPQVWEVVTNAFKSVNATVYENGYIYDTKMTNGLLAINKSKEGLAEMLAEIGHG